MANDSTKKRADQDSPGPAGASRQPKGSDPAGAGDNRRAGDVDGNEAGGHSKSRGATDATDESDRAPAKGA